MHLCRNWYHVRRVDIEFIRHQGLALDIVTGNFVLYWRGHRLFPYDTLRSRMVHTKKGARIWDYVGKLYYGIKLEIMLTSSSQ